MLFLACRLHDVYGNCKQMQMSECRLHDESERWMLNVAWEIQLENNFIQHFSFLNQTIIFQYIWLCSQLSPMTLV